MLRKILSWALSFTLFFTQSGVGWAATELNLAGYLSQMHNTFQDRFRPPHIRYFSYDTLTDDFNIFLDKGNAKDIKGPALEGVARQAFNYFLVGISLNDEKFWVNLRPDSPDQIIDDNLAKTDVGKILLEADLQLKKDTARFTSPETPEGKKYWDLLYKKAGEIFGAENITIPTLTRPWIVPGEIIIRQTEGSAYLYKANLKVMLEQDHLKDSAVYNFKDERLKKLNEYSAQLIRELIIPKLTKEVNTAKSYAALRQAYYSLILARWFKGAFSGKRGVYSGMINRNKLDGLTSKEAWSKMTYFQAYQKSFKEGEYNLRVPVSGMYGQTIRSYFSGGIKLDGMDPSSSPLSSGSFRVKEVTGGIEAILPARRDLEPFNGQAALGTFNAGIGSSSSPAIELNLPDLKDLVNSKKDKEAAYLVLGHGSKGQFKDLDALIRQLDRDADTLDKKHGKGNWLIVYGGDPANPEKPDIGYVVEYLHQKYGAPVLMIQTEGGKNWGIPAHVNYAYFYPVEKNAEGKLLFGGTDAEGKPVAATAVYLSDEFMGKGFIDGIIAYGGGPITEQEVAYGIKKGLPVLYRPFEVRNLGSSGNRLGESHARLDQLATSAKPIEFPQLSAASLVQAIPTTEIKTRLDNLRLYLPEASDAHIQFAEFLSRQLNSDEIFAEGFVNAALLALASLKRGIDAAGNRITGNLVQAPPFMYAILQSFIPNLVRAVTPEDFADEAMEYYKRITNTVSSPATAPEKTGGIDFRTMNIIAQPMGTFTNLKFNLPKLSNLEKVDIDQELGRIKQMVAKGIVPSDQRLKELVAACFQKKELAKHTDELIGCLMDICILQEDLLFETSADLRELLVIVDTHSFVI